MAVAPKIKTHVGPPGLGGGSYDFDSTTKVYAYFGGVLLIGAERQVTYPDIQLDTLGEFVGSVLQPVEDGWYGIGGNVVCSGIPLNTYNGTFGLRIRRIGGDILFESIWDAAPVSGITSCEFYNFVYLVATDAIGIYVRQSPSSPTAYLYQASLFVNRVL